MRKNLLSLLGIVASVAGYFFLLDFVRPELEERHVIPIWWALLGLYVIIVFGGGFWYIGKTRPGFAAIGFLSFASTLYLYDPTINSHLESIGLRWVWIVPLIALFLWLVAWVKTRPRSPNASTPKPPE
jgi:hypothetical protein